jgi:hypothetical protein
MRHITPFHMVGFLSEMQKRANVVGDLWRSHLGGRYGRQLAAGAGLGAAAGVAKSQLTKDEYGQTGPWLPSALRGAALGLAGTGAAQLATKGGRSALKEYAGNSWDRLKYQATGKGLGDTPESRIAKAEHLGLLDKVEEGADAADLGRRRLGEEAVEKGWMSVPGVIHGMVNSPGQLLHNSWHRMPGTGKALTGLGGAFAAKELITPTEEGGPGRAERALRSGVGMLGATIAPPGLLPSIAVGDTMGMLSGRVGRRLDRAFKPKTPQISQPSEVPEGANMIQGTY